MWTNHRAMSPLPKHFLTEDRTVRGLLGFFVYLMLVGVTFRISLLLVPLRMYYRTVASFS